MSKTILDEKNSTNTTKNIVTNGNKTADNTKKFIVTLTKNIIKNGEKSIELN